MKSSIIVVFVFIALAIVTHFAFLYILGSTPIVAQGTLSSAMKDTVGILKSIRVVCLYIIPAIFCIAAFIAWVYARTDPRYIIQSDYYNQHSSFGEWS